MSREPSTQRGRRRALVTGASAGIGEAFARALAAQGTDLTLVARRRDRLDALAKELSERHRVAATVEVADLTDEGDLARLAALVAADPPDLLVNNAGFATKGRFAELDPERELEEIRLNVLAPVALARAAFPGMLARGRGAIVNVSSLAGESPGPYIATYAATKAFVTSFSQALYEEARGSQVVVQALLPGATRTEFQEVADWDPGALPSFAWMRPEQVVRASLAALERGDAICIPGVVNRVLGTLTALAPRGAARRILGVMQKRDLP